MLRIEPIAGVAPIVRFIGEAGARLNINAYLVTDRPVLAAIRQAVRRGVRVRVLLARHPYGQRPRGELKHLQATGAQVRFAPPRFTHRYVFDHAKYMVSGQAVEIGSANLTWSAFHQNREYVWMAHRPAIADDLHRLFVADWTRRSAGPIPRQRLVIAPGATLALVAMIERPGRVCIESEELGRDRPILAALATKGPRAQLVLPARLSASDRRLAQRLATHGVAVRFLRTPYLHAKLIATPGRVFLGSENFTWSSLHRNREVGVTVGGRDAVAALAQCHRDWKRAWP
ncbi:MAG: phospholipase D-like domain-containing protein [Acidiferrobacter sp.]